MIWVRYIFELLITKVFGYLTAWFMYPFAYVFRKCLRKWNKGSWLQKLTSFPLWMYLNDGVSNDVGYPWFWKKIGRQPNGKFWNDFVISYKWSALRNPVWNLYIPLQLQHIPKTDIVVKKSICFNEALLNREVDHIEERHLKFKYADDSYADNEGPYLDYSKAVLGVLFTTYTQGNRKCFRWAKVNITLKSGYLLATELRLGYTDNHSDFFRKRKKLVLDEKSKKEYDNYVLNKNIL